MTFMEFKNLGEGETLFGERLVRWELKLPPRPHVVYDDEGELVEGPEWAFQLVDLVSEGEAIRLVIEVAGGHPRRTPRLSIQQVRDLLQSDETADQMVWLSVPAIRGAYAERPAYEG